MRTCVVNEQENEDVLLVVLSQALFVTSCPAKAGLLLVGLSQK
jgi:hypothetical protein